jgi:GNAT superfamily N-acetyltransferase
VGNPVAGVAVTGLADAVNERPAITVVRSTDPQRFVDTERIVWFDEVVDAPAEVLIGLPEDQRFAAEVDGADPASYPGVYGVFPLQLAVPADTPRLVPCAGLTAVGVHPDHRRRGVLSAMMRHHLEQVHADPQTHVSALHASEPTIYGRYGYGTASLELTLRLGRGTTFTAPHLDDATAGIRTELRSATEPGMPARVRACLLAGAAARLGTVVPEEGYFAHVLREHPEPRQERETKRVLFARRDDRDVGYALLRRTPKWERGRSSSELTVYTLAGDPATRLALLRRLVDFDLIGTVQVFDVGVDDGVLHWLRGPRGAGDVVVNDSLWVRLVDLPEALAARGYRAPCDVVVDVRDRAAPWNAGRWRIVVVDGAAEVTRADTPADLRLDVEALGAAYLGGTSLLSLRDAGLVAEQTPGSTAALWRAMQTDAAPVAALGF